jgi:ArsR family transcriptional regulator
MLRRIDPPLQAGGGRVSKLGRFRLGRIESGMATNASTTVEPLPLTETQVQSIAKALADPRRYEILRTLGEREYATACNDLLGCVDVTAATLSHHMKELEAAGLVRAEKAGKFVRYYPKRQTLRAYLERVQSDLV